MTLEELNIVKRNLSDLKQPERNIRLHPEKQIKEYARSIQKNGVLKLLVIDEENTIWIGNGLYEALLACGYTEAYCIVKTGMTDAAKKKMMISDNKIFDLGVDDLDSLNAYFEELRDDLDIPGFDQELLESMVADADAVTQAISDYGILDDDDLSRMKEAEARQSEAERNAKATLTPPSSDDSGISPAGIGKSEPSSGNGEVQRSIVCPHCGETIWL